MKITRTDIALHGEHRIRETRTIQRREAIRTGGAWLGFDHVLAQEKHAQPAAKTAPGALPPASSAAREAKLLILHLMIQVFNTLLGAGGRSPEFPLAPVHWRRDARGALPATTNDTIEVRITHRARRTEIERSRFLASGVIHTASGETRHFNFGLDMRRRTEQTETATVHIKQIEKLKDPLVINFGGGAAQLHSTRFLFDIDSDGQAERLPALGPGSGFLALDKNGDGAIDNGNEWFGAATGDGFAELAGDDADHNGWIDAADPVFGKLRLWIPNGNGRERLASLAEKHIGALYLGRAATPFTMQDGGALLGQVKASGVFLREDGSVGAMQQIDLSSTG